MSRSKNIHPSEFSFLPKYWLSVPSISKPFSVESMPNLAVFSLKSPLFNVPDTDLLNNYAWSIKKLKEHINSLYPDAKMLAVNSSNDLSSDKEQWLAEGIEYTSIDFDDHYDMHSITDFGHICEEFTSQNEGSKCCVLLYSDLGINRPGFLISGFLVRFGSMSIKDAFNLFTQNHGVGVYKTRAVDALADIFDCRDLEPAEATFKSEDGKHSVGDTVLEADRATNWKAFTRKEMTGSDRSRILEKLAASLPKDCVLENDEVILRDEDWSNETLDKVKKGSYLVTMEPRNKQSYIIVLDTSYVYTVTPNMTVYSTQAAFEDSKAASMIPFVASCTWVDEHARVSALVTDLLMIGGVNVSEKPLLERQKILYSSILPNLKSTSKQLMDLVFTYKPLTALKNTKRLVGDFDKFCGKPESLRFVPLDQPFGHSIFLSIKQTVLLKFEYNGGQKALLTVNNKGENVPIYVYKLNDSANTALNGNPVRFRYENKELIPISLIKEKGYDQIASSDDFARFIRICENQLDTETIINELITLPTPELN